MYSSQGLHAPFFYTCLTSGRCSQKYIKKNFSVDMIVENGDKRKFLKKLVKGYNDKMKNNDSRNYIH